MLCDERYDLLVNEVLTLRSPNTNRDEIRRLCRIPGPNELQGRMNYCCIGLSNLKPMNYCFRKTILSKRGRMDWFNIIILFY